MKTNLGTLAFFLGLIGLIGVGGYITEMPPEATTMDWIKLAGITVNLAMLAQVGIWLIKDEI